MPWHDSAGFTPMTPVGGRSTQHGCPRRSISCSPTAFAIWPGRYGRLAASRRRPSHSANSRGRTFSASACRQPCCRAISNLRMNKRCASRARSMRDIFPDMSTVHDCRSGNGTRLVRGRAPSAWIELQPRLRLHARKRRSLRRRTECRPCSPAQGRGLKHDGEHWRASATLIMPLERSRHHPLLRYLLELSFGLAWA
jgi:hypothetical protein